MSIYRNTFLPASLVEAVLDVITESPQGSRAIEKMGSEKKQAIPHKPSKEDAAKNRLDPVWKKAHDINGSSIITGYNAKSDEEKEAHTDIIEHAFYRVREKRWEFALKEKRDVDRTDPHAIHTVLNNHHFVERATQADRNYTGLSGADIAAFKERAIKKAEELQLVGQLSHDENFKKHVFVSTTNQKTKGYALATRIHPNGKIEISTLLDPTMTTSSTRDTFHTSLIESLLDEVIEIFID